MKLFFFWKILTYLRFESFFRLRNAADFITFIIILQKKIAFFFFKNTLNEMRKFFDVLSRVIFFKKIEKFAFFENSIFFEKSFEFEKISAVKIQKYVTITLFFLRNLTFWLSKKFSKNFFVIRIFFQYNDWYNFDCFWRNFNVLKIHSRNSI